ncbi:hypothetical protein D6851_05765 [Altericroceibacterium spongiae]|uniref:Uncharacterized protein n=1 Tax=Altericroceibacterium spongiae TaxID=2320269 RepID=A0A420EPX0_9SPHN|nr:hypothetical protein [Altericroceibacterium spongiae]RKF22710.1 hypothetical protein D6851_05765 [Altericroceibacterium spongiae]
MMRHFIALGISAFAFVALPAAAQGSDPASKLTAEHETILRCSAAFAMVAGQQDEGNAEANKYPPMDERGREYFVQGMAQIMDDTGMDRTAIIEQLRTQLIDLAQPGKLDEAMPPCLLSLESSDL